MKKSIILTCHTEFALISTEFVRWGCNFTWSTTMPMKFFRILLTNLRKCAKKILFAPQSEFFSVSRDFCLDLLWSKKYIFPKHFRRLVNKIRKNFMCIVVLYVKLQPQQTNSVEMRANSVWQPKIIDFFNVFLINFNY